MPRLPLCPVPSPTPSRSTHISALALLTLLAMAAPVVLGGCAQEVGLIDRVQANYLAKADFGGVWYENQVVTRVPSSSGFGFVGQANFSGKVVFDIQENVIVEYPYSETVVGADAQWNKKKIRKYWDPALRAAEHGPAAKDEDFIDLYVGNPQAIYPVLSHFDIKRDYSPQTGAQSNVLVENTTDRPWWQREYVRVDWLGNTLTNFMFPQGSMKLSPVDYYVPSDEKDDPNRFYGAPEGGYFHFTRRLFGQPMSTGACSPYNLAPGDCAGSDFDVRVSYKRVTPKHFNDYESLQYHNSDAQSKFGFFLADRYTFDENYGLTYSGHDYKIARWNIWQQSKAFELPKDASGKEIVKACLTNRDCDAPQICDQDAWFSPGQCKIGARIDYTERKIRPIIYHLSADHPVDHIPAEYETADTWSKAFQETVSWLRFWEQKWGGDQKVVAGQTPHVGFSDPQAKFGQRFCQTHDDCSQHAVAQVTVPTLTAKNRLVIAAAPGKTVVVEDCPITTQGSKDVCGDHPDTAGSSAVVALVNASAGVATAGVTGFKGGKTISSVPPAKDTVQLMDHAVVLDASGQGTVNLTVDTGSKQLTVPNVKIAAGDTIALVLVGGDAVVVARATGVKSMLRLINGITTGQLSTPDGDISSGDPLEIGVNGVRAHAELDYATVSDDVSYSGLSAHAVFLKPGQRTDVSCMSVGGVPQCTGWRQVVTAEDNAKRTAIREKLPPVFVLCENVFRAKSQCKAGEIGNPLTMNDCRYWTQVEGKDFNPCADLNDGGMVPHAGDAKIGGDSRYNYMYWVTNTEPTSPLGYGPAGPDPDTGEITWATANVYGAALITYAQYAKDLVDLLNGDLDPNSLATGKYIRDYLEKQSKAGANSTDFAALKAGTPEDTVEAARSRATARIRDFVPQDGPAAQPTAKDLQLASDLRQPAQVSKWLQDNQATFDMQTVYDRFAKIQGTDLERAMINDEVALVLSEGQLQPGDQISPEMVGKLSPLGWATPKKPMAEALRMQMLGYNNIELAEFQDPAVFGLAQRMKCQDGQTPITQLGPDDWTKINDTSGKYCFKGDALRTALSVALLAATIEHEVGHTVGLRHNFEGSTDLLNYFDGYFDPQTGRERELVPCASVVTSAGTINGNDICESSRFGETCVPNKACKVDADCPRHFACGAGLCVDADGQGIGTCSGSSHTRLGCTAENGESVCGSGAVCKNNYCEAAIACTDNKPCADGYSCVGKYCTDKRTGLPATTPMFDDSIAELHKYLPRPEVTAKEQLNRRTEYQYSTVMDYGQKINSDIHSLGKYDYAAIKFGYGEMVEVFHDTTYAQDQLARYAKNTGNSYETLSWNMSPGNWGDGMVTSSLDAPNHWMPPEMNVQRETVPWQFVRNEANDAVKYSRNFADMTYWEVPYKYLSDEWAGVQGCYRFDTGASAEEIVYHAGSAITDYYLFDAFKRDRMWFGVGGSPTSYLARITDRWLTPLGNAGRYYALFNNIYRIYPWFSWFENSTFQMAQLRRASLDAFNRLAAMVTAPAPGSFVLDPVTGEYTNIDYQPGKGQRDVDLGPGKFPWTTFASQDGYYYYDHPLWIGGFWDKVAAISTMCSSTAMFLNSYVGEQLAYFRGTAIGFNTIYPKQLASLLGGLAAGDVSEIGGSFDEKTKAYVPRNFFEANPKKVPRVQPSVLNHDVRILAALQAIANLPAGFDPEFTDSMALWLKGNGKGYDIGSTMVGSSQAVIDEVEYKDPFGSKTYLATRPNYDPTRYSPTYRLLQRLNTMTVGCSDGIACAAGKCTDGLACAGKYYSSASGTEKAQLESAIRKELEILDYFRKLYGIYGNIGVQ